jgi:hypothetical protein
MIALLYVQNTMAGEVFRWNNGIMIRVAFLILFPTFQYSNTPMIRRVMRK